MTNIKNIINVEMFFKIKSVLFISLGVSVLVFSTLFGGTAYAAAPAAPSEISLQQPANLSDLDTALYSAIHASKKITIASKPTFVVTASESGGSVTLYSDSGCNSAISSATTVSNTIATNKFPITVTTAFSGDGAKTVYGKHVNARNEASSCKRGGTFTFDGSLPKVLNVKTSFFTEKMTSGLSGFPIKHEVTFSEAMFVNYSDGSSLHNVSQGYPAINYHIGSKKTSFKIVSRSTSLADNQCKPKDGNNTVFVCFTVIGLHNLGLFSIGVEDSTFDRAGNTVSGKYTEIAVTIAGVPVFPSASMLVSNDKNPNIVISGTLKGEAITHYKAVVIDNVTYCNQDGRAVKALNRIAGRSGTSVSQPFTPNVSLLGDGKVAVCVKVATALDGPFGDFSITIVWKKDTTAPTVYSVTRNGTAVTVTMSEPIYAATTPDVGDFTVTNGGAGTSVSGISGISTTASNAVISFTLTLSQNPSGSGMPTISYVPNTGNAAKKIKDTAGNDLGATEFLLDSTTPVVTVNDAIDYRGADKGVMTATYTDPNKFTGTNLNVNALLKTLKISDNGGGVGKVDIDLDWHDRFGYSATLDGDTLAVGAPLDDDGHKDAGAVYLFTKENNSWLQTLKISDNDGGGVGKLHIDLDWEDSFGQSVALDGDTLAVGVLNDDDGGTNSDRGAVYLFTKENGIWTQTLKISENAGDAEGELHIVLSPTDNFGASVALDGNTLAVGAPNNTTGTVYLFTKENGTWTRTLNISDNSGGNKELDVALDRLDAFGSSVALDGDTLAVGARGNDDRGDDASGGNRGAVYLFTKENGTWTHTLKISDNDGGDGKVAIDLANGDQFGSSVALDGNTLAVGASYDDDAHSATGSVYLFTKGAGTWTQTLKISDNDGGAGKVHIDLDWDDRFGRSVALDGDVLVVGAIKDDDDPDNAVGYDLGAVYLFDASAMRYKVQYANKCVATRPVDSLPTDGKVVLTADANEQYVCFWATNAVGNTGSAISSQLSGGSGFTKSLSATFKNWTPATPATSKEIVVIPDSMYDCSGCGEMKMKYKLFPLGVPCTAANYGFGGTPLSKISTTIAGKNVVKNVITVSDEAHNNKYACVALSRHPNTNRYFRSPPVFGIVRSQ